MRTGGGGLHEAAGHRPVTTRLVISAYCGGVKMAGYVPACAATAVTFQPGGRFFLSSEINPRRHPNLSPLFPNAVISGDQISHSLNAHRVPGPVQASGSGQEQDDGPALQSTPPLGRQAVSQGSLSPHSGKPSLRVEWCKRRGGGLGQRERWALKPRGASQGG